MVKILGYSKYEIEIDNIEIEAYDKTMIRFKDGSTLTIADIVKALQVETPAKSILGINNSKVQIKK